MNNTMVELNEGIYMISSDKGDLKILQGNFREEEIKNILSKQDEIENLEEEVSHHKELLSFIKSKNKISEFMVYYRILVPILIMMLAAASNIPYTQTELLFTVFRTYFELTLIGEFVSRIGVCLKALLTSSSTYHRYFNLNPKRLFFLGTKKSRTKEEQEHNQSIENLQGNIQELNQAIQMLKDSTKYKEIPYSDDERVTIAPIDHSLDATTIKISKLEKVKRPSR